jgi:hypothetical protein
MARYALKMIHASGMGKEKALRKAIISVLGEEALRYE